MSLLCRQSHLEWRSSKLSVFIIAHSDRNIKKRQRKRLTDRPRDRPQRERTKDGKSNAPLRKDLLKDGGYPRQFWCDIALSEWSELSKYLELFELRQCMHIKTGRGKWRRMDPHTRENIPRWKDFMAPFKMPYLTLEPSLTMFSARDKLLYGCTADEHCRGKWILTEWLIILVLGNVLQGIKMVYYKCLRSNWQ